MEPVSAPFVSEICFALRDFVRVMRECVVHTAAVDIKIFAEMFDAYG